MTKRREHAPTALGQRRAELSRAELAWLTGDRPEIFTTLDEFFVWSLDHGFPSMHKARAITATEILNTYGHFILPARVRELRERLANVQTAEAAYQRESKR